MHWPNSQKEVSLLRNAGVDSETQRILVVVTVPAMRSGKRSMAEGAIASLQLLPAIVPWRAGRTHYERMPSSVTLKITLSGDVSHPACSLRCGHESPTEGDTGCERCAFAVGAVSWRTGSRFLTREGTGSFGVPPAATSTTWGGCPRTPPSSSGVRLRTDGRDRSRPRSPRSWNDEALERGKDGPEAGCDLRQAPQPVLLASQASL